MESKAFDVLRDYLEARAAFGAGDFDLIRSVLLFRRLSAGEFLQRAGEAAISLNSGTPSTFFIDAIEDSELLLIDPGGIGRPNAL